MDTAESHSLCSLFLCVAPAAGGQFRPEVSAPLCQRGIGANVQEAHQAGEGRRGHERGAGQVQVAVWRRGGHAHRGGGEDAGEKELDLLAIFGDCGICSNVSHALLRQPDMESFFKKKSL